eukprot:SAG31_NODE_11436_length_1030_cov_1.767991_1_plen_210_part_00
MVSKLNLVLLGLPAARLDTSRMSLSKMAARRRLTAVFAGVSAGDVAEAAPAEILSMDVPDPIGTGTDKRGNSPLGKDVQGFQIFGAHPAPFDPNDPVQFDAAFAFYREHGYRPAVCFVWWISSPHCSVSFCCPSSYVVISVLSKPEIAALNSSADQFKNAKGDGPAELFFPLVKHPEWDHTVRHPCVCQSCCYRLYCSPVSSAGHGKTV